MLYLLLAILSSAMVSVMMRLSQGRIDNHVSLLSVNYVMCTVVAGKYALQAGPLFPGVEGIGIALVLGAISGVLFLAGFVLLQWSISKNGVVLSSTFMKLGVLVPTLLSVVVFRETPGVWQIAGFAGACAAIALIHFDNGGGKATRRSGLLLVLLAGGFADSMAKIYEELGNSVLESHFLFYNFLVALLCSLVLVLYKKQRFGRKELFWGVLIGIPNYFCSRFLLLSLSSVPAVAAYPTYSVGTIVAVAVAGVLLFKEKLSRRKGAAMGIILVCLALLNL